MKKWLLSLILIGVLCVTLSSCCKFALVMDYINYINIEADSNASIGYYFADAYFSSLGEEKTTAYPDTLLPRKNNFVTYDIKDYLGMEAGLRIPYFCTEKFFKTLPKDTLSIFIFHTDTLNKYPWKKIRDEYKILQRYDLSFEDVKALKQRIPYPPTSIMSKMKMYPPYQ